LLPRMVHRCWLACLMVDLIVRFSPLLLTFSWRFA
jgi:hypothetical protein